MGVRRWLHRGAFFAGGVTKSSAASASITHPDVVAGALSEILQQFSNPVSNTLDDLGVYCGRTMAELFPVPARLPEVRVTRRWRLPGLVSEDLVFPSAHVPLEPKFRRRFRKQYPETQHVFARRLRPSSAAQRPRLIYLHGYMQPETYVEELTLLTSMALQLNVEIIQLQFPYHGRRTPRAARFSGELYWTADLVRSIEALRQTVFDVRTLLRLLQKEDDRPVGVAGLSLGGALTLSLTCLEERFAFSIPLIAHMDLGALVADAPVLGRMRRDLRSFGWASEDFGAFVTDIGWYHLRPKLPTARILVIAASEDRFFDPRVLKGMWQSWGRPAIRWYPTSHMGFLAHLPDALRVMRRFIDRQQDGALAAHTK